MGRAYVINSFLIKGGLMKDYELDGITISVEDGVIIYIDGTNVTDMSDKDLKPYYSMLNKLS